MSFGKSLILSNHQLPVVLCRRVYHCFAFLKAYSHGLFTKYMLSRPQGLYGNFCVCMIGRTDTHRIDSPVSQQSICRIIYFSAVNCSQLPCPFLVEIIIACNLGSGMRPVFRDVSCLCDPSAPNDSYLHSVFLPLPIGFHIAFHFFHFFKVILTFY